MRAVAVGSEVRREALVEQRGAGAR